MTAAVALAIDPAPAAATPGTPGPADPQRRCIVTGEDRPKAELLRFVVGPDGTVVFDLEGRLPGRGLWTLAQRDIVAAAVQRRAFARAAKQPATADAALPDWVETSLVRRCIERLGLARRAGLAVGGFEKAQDWVTRGRCGALVAAADASAEGLRKLVRGGVPVVNVLSADELGQVFAHEALTYVAVGRGDLAERLVADAKRLADFRKAGETIRRP